MHSLKDTPAFRLLPRLLHPVTLAFLVFFSIILAFLPTPSVLHQSLLPPPPGSLSNLTPTTRLLWLCHEHIYNQVSHAKCVNINTSRQAATNQNVPQLGEGDPLLSKIELSDSWDPGGGGGGISGKRLE